MMFRYESYRYLYPPRPEIVVEPELLDNFVGRYWTQSKKDGTSNLMAITPDRQIIAMNRHKAPHKAWKPSGSTYEAVRRAFLNLPGNGWYYFCAELLHSKGGGFRNINYINDILVTDGQYLIGTTFADRQKLLLELFRPMVMAPSGSHYILDDNTWLAINHTTDFYDLFQTFLAAGDEGVVLKDPSAKLGWCSSPTANSTWQRKCRRPGKAYGR